MGQFSGGVAKLSPGIDSSLLEIARAGLGFGPPGQFPWSEPGPVIFQAFWVMGFSDCSGFLGYMGFWGFLGLEGCNFAVILLSCAWANSWDNKNSKND